MIQSEYELMSVEFTGEPNSAISLGARRAVPDGATLRICNSKAKGLWSNVRPCPIFARGPYL
jgi:hypothetical protein